MLLARSTSAALPKMPPVDVVVELFRHNAMMNQRLLEACRTLSAEQLDATAPGTYGAIGATLVHIANAQAGYAARLVDVERPERLLEDPFPGFDVVSARLAQPTRSSSTRRPGPGRIGRSR